jgi:hypothetical protein
MVTRGHFLSHVAPQQAQGSAISNMGCAATGTSASASRPAAIAHLKGPGVDN